MRCECLDAAQLIRRVYLCAEPIVCMEIFWWCVLEGLLEEYCDAGVLLQGVVMEVLVTVNYIVYLRLERFQPDVFRVVVNDDQ